MPGRVLIVDDSTTIRKLLRTVLEESGYAVTDAADGQSALESLAKTAAELVLVDFVMPRMNGYQLAMAMRNHPQFKQVPIVLMSAKADQIAERFIRQTGAIDAITKPFSPDALVALVGHALSKQQGHVQPPTLVNEELRSHSQLQPPPQMVDDEDDEDSQRRAVDAFRPTLIPGQEVTGLSPLGASQAIASQRLAEALARVVTPAVVAATRENRTVTDTVIASAIASVMTPTELVGLANELRLFDSDLRGRLALEGVIELIPLGETLQLLRLQQQTGVLTVRRKAAEVAICFYQGNLDVALARGVAPEFLLGRYLVASGSITRENLDTVLRTRPEGSGWLGEYLLRNQVISKEGLETALLRQTSEIIYEVLRWNDGYYRFEHGVVLTEAESARLGIPVESLVLEGFRRVDEWRVVEQEVSSFESVLVRDERIIETVGLSRLSKEERTILDAIDGARTVRDVVHAVAMNSFDVCKVLYRLLRSKLVRRRGS